MIPESEWRWFGAPLHYICGSRCVFHLGTRIGNYVISTVGDFRPDGPYKPRDTIGYQREFETMVFRVLGDHGDCVCPQIDGSEIDSYTYPMGSECDAVNAGHLAMCHKWANDGVE